MEAILMMHTMKGDDSVDRGCVLMASIVVHASNDLFCSDTDEYLISVCVPSAFATYSFGQLASHLGCIGAMP